MGEDFYCTLKLISGEEIFSLISIDENDGDPLILLQNPVVLKFVSNVSGSYVKIKPWINISDDDIQVIKFEKIITMTEIKNSIVIETYKKYIKNIKNEDFAYEYSEKNLEKESGEVKLSEKMGYITSVKEAREVLENLFKQS
jgi:hypothetical protein